MAGINFSGFSANNYSTLFDSLGKSSNQFGTNFLSDWASIRNGSYNKLAKTYYSKERIASREEAADDEETKSVAKANSLFKNDANGLQESISKISDSKLLSSKVTTKDADGNETTDYDRDKIAKALGSFVNDYNSVISKGGDSNSNSVLRYTLAMTTATSRNSSRLEDIGITVGKDNKLSLDESVAKKANVDDIKALFQGQGSYASTIESAAGNIEIAVNAENNKLNNYNAQGSFASFNSMGNIYDNFY